MHTSADPTKPLAGIRVLEMGQLIAGPFAGCMLAYFGAEVVKIEPPGTGDPLRNWRVLKDGTSLWWRAMGRNKKCITLNLREPRGRELARSLALRSDVLVENFRPGTLERWGLGPDELRAEAPDLVYARVSGYGQTGPSAAKPGFASVCEGFGGLRYINGFPGGPPVRPNLSLGDTLAALHAVIGVLLALVHRNRIDAGAVGGSTAGGSGQVVDVAIYESVYNVLEAMVPEYDGAGIVREPSGSTLTGIVPTNTYPCADERYVIIGGNADSIFKRLMRTAGRDDLADDPRLADNAGRVAHQKRGGRRDCRMDAHARLRPRAGGTRQRRRPGRPHLQRRGHDARPAVQRPRDCSRPIEVAGEPLKVPALVPKLGDTPGATLWPGPEIGAHNRDDLRRHAGSRRRQAPLAPRTTASSESRASCRREVHAARRPPRAPPWRMRPRPRGPTAFHLSLRPLSRAPPALEESGTGQFPPPDPPRVAKHPSLPRKIRRISKACIDSVDEFRH